MPTASIKSELGARRKKNGLKLNKIVGEFDLRGFNMVGWGGTQLHLTQGKVKFQNIW